VEEEVEEEAGEARMSAMIIFFSAVPASGISFWALFEGVSSIYF
jgi:hypothetical protein